MVRVRLTYAKRGRACFIPHIAIPSIFARSAARASVAFQFSEGFSPHPKISLGPELSVGIPALCEPLEVWLKSFDEETVRRWNAFLPEGFSLRGGMEIVASPGSEEAKPLSKWCGAASCLLALRKEHENPSALLQCLEELQADGTVFFFDKVPSFPPGFFRCILEEPSKRSPGVLVKSLINSGVMTGWSEVFLVREVVGTLFLPQGKENVPVVLPLVPHSAYGGTRC